MFSIKSLISGFVDLVASGATDKDIDNLLESVKVLNYDLSLVRYKDSEDEDMRLAYEYLKKRPFCMALYPYEKKRNMSPVKVCYDEGLKMNYVMHNGHPLYFPKGENEKFVSWLYRYVIEEDDVMGNGYRQRNPHAYQSERYHIEEGDVLIDAGDGRCLSASDMVDDVMSQISKVISDVNDGYGVHSLRRGVIRAASF